MPNENWVCRTKREALASALDVKRQWNDEEYQKPRAERDFLTGRAGWYSNSKECIEVGACYEADCLKDIEEY